MFFQKIAALASALTFILSPAPQFVCSSSAAAADVLAESAAETTERTAEDFLLNPAETSCATVQISEDRSTLFQMNGKRFYQGLVFSTNYSNQTAYVQYDVENVETLSFTIGHVDDSALRDATLRIYLDEKLNDEISVTAMMNLKSYTLDVSESSVLRFSIYDNTNSINALQYALGDFTVDASAPRFSSEAIPFTNSELFVESGFNHYGRRLYDGESDLNGFDMNGRTYYQGIVLSTNFSNEAAYTQYNVETISALSFTIGHVDNSALRNATLQIYLDGKLKDEISLTSTMNLKSYLLDVSEASVLRFYLYEDTNFSTNLQYGLADFIVNVSIPLYPNEIPSYPSAERFLKSGFNHYGRTLYDGESDLNGFDMNGRTYHQGIVLSTNFSNEAAYTQYNVENADALSFTVGHVDNSALRNATLQIYLDGKLNDEISLTSTMNLKSYSLDVSEASVLRFYLYEDTNFSTNLQYGLADFTVDNSAPQFPNETPSYSSAERFLKSGFNHYGRTLYDGESDLNGFGMNGRSFYQGIVFSTNFSNEAAYTQYNVETISTLSFTIGHVDDTALRDATLQIYLDGKLKDEISLTSTMNLKSYSLDVSDASVLRFYLYEDTNFSTNLQYGLADFTVDNSAPQFPNETPSYSSAERFLKSGFNHYGRTLYDGESDLNGFGMNGRAFYLGLVFTTDFYGTAAYTQYNVENLDAISFTIGHVDNSALRDATLRIYLDGKLTDEVALTASMEQQFYHLDISEASVLRFYVYESKSSSTELQYGLGDFKITAKGESREVFTGDVNRDDTLSIADAVILSRFLAEDAALTSVYVHNADVNEDSLYNIADIMQILHFLYQSTAEQ